MKTQEQAKQVMREVAEYFKSSGKGRLDLHFAGEDQLSGTLDEYSDSCFVLGSDTIEVGKFADSERMLLGFFHEVGHLLLKDQKSSTFLHELCCWDRGIDFAAQRGIYFTDAAIRWGYERAFTYCGHDEREYMGWEHKIRPTLWFYSEDWGKYA